MSRNFRLQRVGDVNWLLDKFKFKNIGDVIDELVIFNVDRNRPSFLNKAFFSDCEKLLENVYVPFAFGGGIGTIDEVNRCFLFGCDKVIFSTAFFDNRYIIDFAKEHYGNQAVVLNIDYKIEEGNRICYVNNGTQVQMNLIDCLKEVELYMPGELILNNITNDGTGVGFDIETIALVENAHIPIIIAGGAGKPEHFLTVLVNDHISAAATGNLFNFLGSGFYDVRKYLFEKGINVREIS